MRKRKEPSHRRKCASLCRETKENVTGTYVYDKSGQLIKISSRVPGLSSGGDSCDPDIGDSPGDGDTESREDFSGGDVDSD